MEPSHGCLEPESEKEVKLIFKADLESSYNVVLSINIPGVGKSILQAKSHEISWSSKIFKMILVQPIKFGLV